MKRILFGALALSFLLSGAMAQTVTVQEAQTVAVNFWNRHHPAEVSGVKASETTLLSYGEINHMYVVNVADRGFVIVAGDRCPDGSGAILLYESEDALHWRYRDLHSVTSGQMSKRAAGLRALSILIPSHIESPLAGDRLYLLHVHVIDPDPVPAPQVLHHSADPQRASLHFHLHRSVRQVLDPAGEIESPGRVHGLVPESYSLYPSAENDMFPDLSGLRVKILHPRSSLSHEHRHEVLVR